MPIPLRIALLAAALTLSACNGVSVVGGAADVAPVVDASAVRDAIPERDTSGGCLLVTCESAGATCGPIGDGCGGILRCGTCAAPQTCGGGGQPSRCGGTSGCVPRTCVSAGANCGPVADGCGGLLECGSCPSGQACGVGGAASVCAPVVQTDSGAIACVPRTCMSAGMSCGPAGDGCGGLLQCGTCPTGQTCGGGGVPGQCGAAACTRRTCMSAGANCGPVADGCGGLLQCGTCPMGQTCGGGGQASVCGSLTSTACVPRTCGALGANCGPVSDGCGGLLDCGTCPMGQTCGGGGRPSVCGTGGAPDAGVTCVRRTCMGVGANCGPVSDGCGGLLQCGMCPSGQTCGGGGRPSVCGTGGAPDAGVTCVRRTCMGVGANCGPVSDGCGGLLQCGTCPMGQTCGGGGRASVCGAPTCVRRTCGATGANCGPVADGCGGIIECGTCAPGQTCGAVTPSVCGTSGGGGTSCTGLCTRRATCATGVVTTISGTVVTPAMTNPDPLYNAVVYIPNAPVAPFAPGVACDRCGAPTSGAPVVSAVTGPDGRFVLRDVPVGANIPLVIQIGRWRRQVTISNVAPCVDNALPTTLTRLPRNRMEGDIPLMAMVTGNVDALECVLRKIGVDDTEFTTPAGGGRVQMYVANGANAGRNTPAASVLYNDPATLARYDMVLFACEGAHITKPTTAQRNLVDYANLGGRVFATHFSYTWLYNVAPFTQVATWNIRQSNPRSPLTGIVDTSFPRGAAFAQWLRNVGAATGMNQISITDPRHDVDAVVAPTARWIYSTSPNTVQHLTFNTPVGAAPDAQCGRVLFSDFHVSNASTGGRTFPAECSGTTLTAQEKVLEFMLFDLASCVAPDMPPPPRCTPRTCMAAGASCGPIGDGCGGVIQCGTCPTGQTCGGGGTPSVCGTMTCRPRNCIEQGISCGPAGNGCGGMIDCGGCATGQTCGGGGSPGVCGTPACRPQTCSDQGIQCGPAGDGCGATLQCGTCPSGTTCGGGGRPGVCGSPACRPTTCMAQGLSCGPAGDGCGGVIQCGTCPTGMTCGGGGVPGMCGSATCRPTTCMAQGLSCGPAGDGCGGTLDCGTCAAPLTCGGAGVPGQCGMSACHPRTCMDQGIQCGPAGDGCGGTLDCGTCAPGTTCGGGGPGLCGAPGCRPRTCMDQGIQCGPAGDGCGNVIQCGNCVAPQTCGGGGMLGVCGRGTCTPRACTDANAECGYIADGCGGLLNCGMCPAGQACGFNGVANRCGAPG